MVKTTRGAAAQRDYRDLVLRGGVAGEISYPWLRCGDTPRLQGWKLHISSIPTQAPLLLRILVPELKAADVPFKVALGPDVLFALNEGAFGSTQIGKFVTIYPATTHAAVTLAEHLLQVLDGFDGPSIPTDLHLGGVIYARYGGFNPQVVRNILGSSERFIRSPTGEMLPDLYTVPFRFPDGVADPFGAMAVAGSEPDIGHRIADTSYLVIDRIRTQPKGDVLLALDLQAQESVSAKVIKQGRRQGLSDTLGRDMAARLQKQFRMHRVLAGKVRLPAARQCFDAGGSTYLVLDHTEAETLESVVQQALSGRSWASLGNSAKGKLIEILAEVARRVAELHEAGVVHRDLTASNLLVEGSGTVTLIDLELAHDIHDVATPFERGTEGFMSPSQQQGGAPTLADDIYSLGCIFAYAATGFDPRRLPLDALCNRDSRAAVALFAGVPAKVIAVIADMLSLDPDHRPTAREIEARLMEAKGGSGRAIMLVTTDPAASPPVDRRVVLAAAEGLLKHVCVRDADGLWLSGPVSQATPAQAFVPEACRSAHRGVAGPLYVLARGLRTGVLDHDEVRGRSLQAVRWLGGGEPTPDAAMPGLHFGEAGVAVALAEAIAGGAAEGTAEQIAAIRRALTIMPEWLDVTHGVAGIGFAALNCAQRLPEHGFAALATPLARRLVAAQHADGSWITPPGVDGMSGETLTGFAHGVAGMAAFLADYARIVDRTPVWTALDQATDWLLRQACPTSDGAIAWPYSDARREPWHWWCHGAPGIALALLRIYSATGRPNLPSAIRTALLTHPVDIRSPNLSQCHGLAGLAEIYLEAHQVLGDPEWRLRADKIIELILGLAKRHDDGAFTWLVENPQVPVGDLMTGCSGILHVLLRASGARLNFPLLPDLA